MSQKHYLFEDSILTNILIGEKSNDYDEKKYEFAIKISNLARFLDSLENRENTVIGANNKNLSGGQQKKVHIARCFYQMNDKKKLVILDEPFENLDEESKLNFMVQLNKIKKKTTIIIISHDEKDLKICDRIFNLENNSYNNL